MLGLEKVTKFLNIIFNSPNVKNEKPISVLLVAPVSHGKTTAVKQFYENKQVRVLTDCTAYGVLKNYEQDLREKKIRYIIIPDLLHPLSRRKTTVDTFIMFINASSEDGLQPSKTYAYDIKQPIEPFGWVACVTEEMYQRKKEQLDRIGLSSRFLIVKYRYSLETIQKIIMNVIQEKDVKVPKLKIAKKNKNIKGNENIFQELNLFSKLIAGSDAEGIRIQKNLQTFLKASAYTRGDNKVNEKDLENLKELIELLK